MSREKLRKKQKQVRRARVARHSLAYTALGTLVLAGGVLLITAPGLTEIARTLPGGRRSPSQIVNILEGLCRRGYVTLTGTKGKRMAHITDAGRKRAYLDSLSIAVPRKEEWDELWYMVSFDIPTTHKRARDALRTKLRELGFVEYQKSVYLFPASCASEIDFIVEYFSVDRWVRRFFVSDLEDDARYRAHFGLT